MYSYSVDPTNIPKHLSNPQLEYFILFAVLVAGKGAKQTYKKLNEFLERNAVGEGFLHDEGVILTPFETIKMLDWYCELGLELEASRFGQYERILPALSRVSQLDLESLDVPTLENIPGIGPKTARFIMLYASPSFDGVPLDTHVLKYLKSCGYTVPKSTPPAGARYEELERAFQAEAMSRDMTVRELDTEVWNKYNSGQMRKTS